MIRGSRFFLLDFLRLLASIGVIIFHVNSTTLDWTKNLYLMVDLFFVLSGFVLMPVFPKNNSWLELRKFVTKRLWRLLPTTWVSLFFVLAYAIVVNISISFGETQNSSEMPISIASFLSALLLLQIFSTSATLLNYPLWSLSAEFLANIFMAFQMKFIKSRNFLVVLFIFNALFLWLISFMASYQGLYQFTQALNEISIGMAFRLFFDAKTRVTFVRTKVILVSVMVFLLLFMIDLEPWQTEKLSVIFSGLLILHIANFERMYGFRFSKRIASISGSLSFGLYVWHVPLSGISSRLLQVVQVESPITELLFLLVLSAAAALVSIFLIERPINQWRLHRNSI